MIQFHALEDIIADRGLRIVLVQGLPSPWGQAAKTLFEIKGLEYRAAALAAGEANEAIVAWAGENSAPIVAWADEKPIDRWIDILYLAERLAPRPALIPAEPAERALMIGFAHEICGELGIGWNRRLQMFAPFLDGAEPPPGMSRMGRKYRYNRADVAAAGERIAVSLRALAAQLAAQQARGSRFFVGERLSALDVYWTAFSNLLDPMPPERCPVAEEWRPFFVPTDPVVRNALDPILFAHRDRIFAEHFRSPMEF